MNKRVVLEPLPVLVFALRATSLQKNLAAARHNETSLLRSGLNSGRISCRRIIRVSVSINGKTKMNLRFLSPFKKEQIEYEVAALRRGEKYFQVRREENHCGAGAHREHCDLKLRLII